MARRINWGRLDFSKLAFHTMDKLGDDAALAKWTRDLLRGLTGNATGLNALADEILAEAQDYREADAERQRRSRGGMSRDVTVTHAESTAHNTPHHNKAKQGEKKARARARTPSPDRERSEGKDPLRAAMVEIFGPRGIGNALRDLRAMGATPDRLRKVAKLADQQWEGRAFGPEALVKHWRRLEAKLPKEPKLCAHGHSGFCMDCAVDAAGGSEMVGAPPEGFNWPKF